MLVVEEVDPVMEKDVLAVLGKNGVDKKFMENWMDVTAYL